MLKLIFSDMDGTLLDERDKIPAEFPEVMAMLKEHHVTFVPASGRQVYTLMDMFPDFQDQFIFLGDNGTMVRQHGKELFANTMNPAEALPIIHSVERIKGIYSVYCGKKSVYLLNGTGVEPYMDEMYKYYARIKLVDSFDAVDDVPVKMSFYTPEADADARIYPLLQRYEANYQVALASAYWVDITNKGANKGLAVRKLQEILGIKPEECAAFGDYMNDKEMLQSVYYSYAMANAHPVIKTVARFEAKSNAEHGVMQQIKQFIKDGLC